MAVETAEAAVKDGKANGRSEGFLEGALITTIADSDGEAGPRC